MLNGLLIAIGAIVIIVTAVVAYAATRADTFRITRSLRIHAPPERIYALLDDFRQWPRWSPYEHLDPSMQRAYSGAATGPGAVYAWSGAGKAGAGRMEIASVEAARRVSLKLDFSKPFVAHNEVDFTLVADSGFTNVTWAMHGPQPLMAKIMGLFLNMDAMVGKDFEAGLANLKSAAES